MDCKQGLHPGTDKFTSLGCAGACVCIEHPYPTNSTGHHVRPRAPTDMQMMTKSKRKASMGLCYVQLSTGCRPRARVFNREQPHHALRGAAMVRQDSSGRGPQPGTLHGPYTPMSLQRYIQVSHLPCLRGSCMRHRAQSTPIQQSRAKDNNLFPSGLSSSPVKRVFRSSSTCHEVHRQQMVQHPWHVNPRPLSQQLGMHRVNLCRTDEIAFLMKQGTHISGLNPALLYKMIWT